MKKEIKITKEVKEEEKSTSLFGIITNVIKALDFNLDVNVNDVNIKASQNKFTVEKVEKKTTRKPRTTNKKTTNKPRKKTTTKK